MVATPSSDSGVHRLDGSEHAAALDSTTLDATSALHGLLPKLSGLAANALLGDGTWGTRELLTISPAELTANTNDWNPTDLATADVIRVSTDASHNLSGIVAPTGAKTMILVNVGAEDIVLLHDVTSTAANRFYTPDDADVTLTKDSALVLTYDLTSARWRVVGGVGGGGEPVPFVDASPPPTPIDGMLWWDTSMGALKVWNDTLGAWVSAVGSGGVGSGKVQIQASWDGAGSTPAADTFIDIVVPTDGIITDWIMIGDVSGSAQVKIAKDSYTNQPPTFPDDLITASAPPSMTTSPYAASSTLTGWTTAVSAGDVLRFYLVSASTLTKVTVALNYSRQPGLVRDVCGRGWWWDRHRLWRQGRPPRPFPVHHHRLVDPPRPDWQHRLRPLEGRPSQLPA